MVLGQMSRESKSVPTQLNIVPHWFSSGGFVFYAPAEALFQGVGGLFLYHQTILSWGKAVFLSSAENKETIDDRYNLVLPLYPITFI